MLINGTITKIRKEEKHDIIWVYFHSTRCVDALLRQEEVNRTKEERD